MPRRVIRMITGGVTSCGSVGLTAGRSSGRWLPTFGQPPFPSRSPPRGRASTGASLLDVGVGAGGLVISFCRQWSTLAATGIDVWEPALALARERVIQAGLEARIELRRQDVCDLEVRDAYDLAWMPVNFIAETALVAAVARLRLAAHPGAWMILSLLRGGAPLSDAVVRLRTARAGGATISAAEAESLLRSEGWEDVHTVTHDVPPSVRLVAARRPIDS